VGEDGRVVAFEPSPFAYANLKKATQGKENITLVHKGVFSESKTLILHAKRKGDGMASVMYDAGKIKTEVPLIPLRDYPEDFDWAKIDVEGAELDVLRGMSKPTKSVLEVAGGILAEYGEGIEKFFSDIEALGYRIFFIVEDGETIPWDGTNSHDLRDNIYIEPK
jgi:FkbM family methyltransferase